MGSFPMDIQPQHITLARLFDKRLFRIPAYQRAIAGSRNTERSMSGISLVWKSTVHEEDAFNLAEMFEYLPGGVKSDWREKTDRPKKSYDLKGWEERRAAVNVATPELVVWESSMHMDDWHKRQNIMELSIKTDERYFVAKKPGEDDVEKSIRAAIKFSNPAFGLNCNPRTGVGVLCKTDVQSSWMSILVWKCEDFWGIDFGGSRGPNTLNVLKNVLRKIDLGCAEIIPNPPIHGEESNEGRESSESGGRKITKWVRKVVRKLFALKGMGWNLILAGLERLGWRGC